MKAFILVGGLATRLGEIVKQIPKAMLPIAGKPFLQYQIEQLRNSGIKDIVLCVGHLASSMIEYFGNGAKLGVNISYSCEETPLGTGGAIKNAEKFVDGPFIVINGDTYFEIDYSKLIETHKTNGSKITLVLNRVPDCGDYGSVILGKENRILNFAEKTHKGEGLMSSGFYLIEPEVLKDMPANQKVSIEQEVFPKFVAKGQISGLEMSGYHIDIGVPARLEKFKQDAEAGVV